MTPPGSPSADDERKPPLAPDLGAVQVSYTWKFGEGGASVEEAAPPAAPDDELESLRRQVAQFTAALEDIVTLALSNADYKERAIMMHRRAVAALSVKRPGRQKG
jgi:hypothetical protein